MALLEILEYPDKRLRLKALPVAAVTAEIQAIVKDMFETLYHTRAVGLAATQANIQKRIIVLDASDEGNTPICAINPEIVSRRGVQHEFEGCVSFPGVYDKIERAASVVLRAQDKNGDPFEMTAEGLLAACIQHEYDHLDGILFFDHLSRLKQDRLRKKLEKYRSRVE